MLPVLGGGVATFGWRRCYCWMAVLVLLSGSVTAIGVGGVLAVLLSRFLPRLHHHHHHHPLLRFFFWGGAILWFGSVCVSQSLKKKHTRDPTQNRKRSSMYDTLQPLRGSQQRE